MGGQAVRHTVVHVGWLCHQKFNQLNATNSELTSKWTTYDPKTIQHIFQIASSGYQLQEMLYTVIYIF